MVFSAYFVRYGPIIVGVVFIVYIILCGVRHWNHFTCAWFTEKQLIEHVSICESHAGWLFWLFTFFFSFSISLTVCYSVCTSVTFVLQVSLFGCTINMFFRVGNSSFSLRLHTYHESLFALPYIAFMCASTWSFILSSISVHVCIYQSNTLYSQTHFFTLTGSWTFGFFSGVPFFFLFYIWGHAFKVKG